MVRVALWLLFAAYLGFIGFAYATERLFYGEVVHLTGLRAVQFLVATFALGAITRVFRRARWPKLLLRFRRDLGLMVFFLAAAHTAVYVQRHDNARIASEAVTGEYGTGWIALIVFLLLALTSNNASVRRLGRNWKRLHRLAYAAAGLSLAHWWLTAFDPMVATPYVAATIAVLVAAPIVSALRRSPGD
ncbi:MAG: ferric reductase-like transmembrane domain-containing protein [Pseudomonadota bacterium]